MNICIPKEQAEELKSLIDSGKVSVQDIKGYLSKERVEFFSKYMGEDLAKKLNIGFEQRINSDTKDILEKYIERELTKVPKEVKKDLTSRLLKMKDFLSPNESGQFLDELVAHKLGVYVEPQTAERILKFAEKAQELESKISDKVLDIKMSLSGKPNPVDGYSTEQLQKIMDERLAYGRAQYDVKTYLEEVLKTRQAAVPAPDGVIPKAWHYFAKGVGEFVSVTKALKATLDNSLFGRQGWKTMTTDPKIWAKNFVKSWGDIASSWADSKKSRRLMDVDGNPTEFFYENVMRETYADVISRPNALTGKYQAANNEYGLGVSAEELFPKLFDYTAGSKMELVFGNKVINLPVRIHKGFENAFSAGSLRMRADLADGLIRNLEAKGINVMDKKVANVLGEFVSSFTGRGEIGKLASIGNELGTVLFSPRFLKSQVDTALHPFKIATKLGAFKDVPDVVRREIAKKYIRYIGLNASLLAVLEFADVTSLDPRSDAFGYLVIGERKYDMTGGARGLFALAAKMLSDERKDYTTGRTYLASEQYKYSKFDEVVNFFSGKRAPALSIAWSLTFGTGTNFDGYQIQPTDGKSLKNLVNELFVPITIDTWVDMAKFEEPTWIQGGLAEFIGVSNRAQVNRPNYGKWQDLLNSNEDQYKKAVDEYNAEIWKLVRSTKGKPQYTKMSREDLSEFYTNEISDIRTGIIDKYGRFIDKKFIKKD